MDPARLDSQGRYPQASLRAAANEIGRTMVNQGPVLTGENRKQHNLRPLNKARSVVDCRRSCQPIGRGRRCIVPAAASSLLPGWRRRVAASIAIAAPWDACASAASGRAFHRRWYATCSIATAGCLPPFGKSSNNIPPALRQNAERISGRQERITNQAEGRGLITPQSLSPLWHVGSLKRSDPVGRQYTCGAGHQVVALCFTRVSRAQ